MEHIAHAERLALSGRIVSRRRYKAHHFAAGLALLGALLHASEHVMLYAESFTAVRELLAIVRIAK